MQKRLHMDGTPVMARLGVVKEALGQLRQAAGRYTRARMFAFGVWTVRVVRVCGVVPGRGRACIAYR